MNKRACLRFTVFAACALSQSLFNGVDAADADLASELLDTTGVSPHISAASDVIFDDALPKQSRCFVQKNEVMNEGDKLALKNLIEDHFGATVALPRAVNVINEAMSTEDLALVQAFFNSSVGKRIVAAEQASKDFDEKTFDAYLDAHINSSAWDDKRFKLIEAVFDATRSARFVSTLNGELLVAITLSAHCETDAEAMKRLQPQLDTLRSESQFIEPLMRGELIPLVGTVFRNVPNSDLEAYAEFAQSTLGVKFFDALVQATKHSLSEGALSFRQSLDQ